MGESYVSSVVEESLQAHCEALTTNNAVNIFRKKINWWIESRIEPKQGHLWLVSNV